MLRPNFFRTSRRFIWRDSKTKHRWFRYSKLEKSRTQWRRFSGSAPITSSVSQTLVDLFYTCTVGTIQFSTYWSRRKYQHNHPRMCAFDLHSLIVANDFYGNLFRVTSTSSPITSSDNCWEYTTAMWRQDLIATVQYLTNPESCQKSNL